MSKFYKALEKAEQERTLRRQDRLQETVRIDRPPSLRSSRAEEEAAKPTLESLTPPPGTIEPHLVSLIAPETFEAEQYRTLSSLIEQMHADTGLSFIAAYSQ